MSEESKIDRLDLYRSIPGIASQDIPVSNLSPVYVFFEKRKAAAQKYLEYSSPEAQDMLIVLIQICNDSIKRYLAL
jgi:hypothetical protein